MGKKLGLVLVIGYLAIGTSSLAQRQNDNLWIDPRSLTILMYYSPDFWPTLKTSAMLSANLILPLANPASDSPLTVSMFGTQGPTYQDYREAIFDRPLPGIRRYGIPKVGDNSKIAIKSAPMVTFPLPPPQPLDLSGRPLTNPR